MKLTKGFSAGIFIFGVALCILSCNSNRDIEARYRLQKKIWKARSLERRMKVDYRRIYSRDLNLAIETYKDVIAGDPLASGIPDNWRGDIIKDIREMIVASKISLVELYFLTESFHQAGFCYRNSIAEAYLPLRQGIYAEPSLTKRLCFAGCDDSIEEECEKLFEEVVQSREFWEKKFEIEDAFLDIPLVLLRVYKSKGEKKKYARCNELTESFYSRIIRSWPDDIIAEKARLKRASLFMIRGEWKRSLNDLDDILSSRYGKEIASQLLLLKGKIYLIGFENIRLAKKSFSDAIRKDPNSSAAYAAGLEIAGIYMERGDSDKGIRILKNLSRDEKAPEDVRSSAMLLRSLYHEKQGQWSEAMVLLNRVRNLFPFTSAAIKAPLMITRHFLASGDTSLALRSLERARRYYESIIKSANVMGSIGHSAEDFMIENYLVLGKSRAVAKLLAEDSKDWFWPFNADALLKSAWIYRDLLREPVKAKEVLKKCIALYPKTRYAKIAEQQLNDLGPE